jgi:inner membrane transporter RhtA
MIAILTLLIAMLSIQSGASLAKQLFPVVGVQGTTTLRIAIAAVILNLIWRPWSHQGLNRAHLKVLVKYGMALGLMNLLFYLALERIPLGIAVALEFTGPLTISLLASRRRIDFLWAFLAAIGIAFILPLQGTAQPLDPIGIGFALGAGACWALYIFFGQKISATLHGGIAAALGMAVAALVVLPFGLVTEGAKLLNGDIWPLALAVALLSSAIPYSLEMIALKKLPAKTFGILMSLEPAVAALSGFLFLSEKLATSQWLAILCVIGASAGSASKSTEKAI